MRRGNNHKSKHYGHQQQHLEQQQQKRTKLDLEIWMGSQFKALEVITHQKFIHILDDRSKDLQFISLRKINFDALAVHQIMKRNFTHLRILSLDFNNIGSRGCKLTAQGQWNSLECLQLQRNNIGSSGVKYLMRMTVPSLKLLSLKANYIDGEGVIAITKNRFMKLTTLYFQHNNTNYEALKHFLGAVTPTTRLYLSLYQGDKAMAVQMQNLFGRKQTLQFIEVALD